MVSLTQHPGAISLWKHGLVFPLKSQGKSDLPVLIWLGPSAAKGGAIKTMVTVSLSNACPQVSACRAECILSEAVQHWTGSKAPFPVYIHFILWPCKSYSEALAVVATSTTLYRMTHNPKQPAKKTA